MPANLTVEYSELSRGLLFLKWLFVIPAYFVMYIWGVIAYLLTFIAAFAVLLTGRYPGGLFNFVRGYLAFQARTFAYFPLLLSDAYPFSELDATVELEVEEPERLSRGLVLMKLPIFLLGALGFVVGLVGSVLVLAAIPVWFNILFTRQYPRGMFNFVVVGAEWCARAMEIGRASCRERV